MENQEKTIHTKASTALCTNATEQPPVAFCVSKEPQKRHSSESLSKYASFLGKTGAVGPSAAEAPGFRPRRAAGKADVSRTRTGSHSCSRLVWSLQGHRYVSLCCDSTEVPGRAPPGLRGAGGNLRGRRGRGRERAAARGSVGEPLARLLPAAGGAPQVPVLHAVHLAALFALSPRLPARHKGRRRQSGAQRAFPGGLRTPRRMEKGEASSGSARSHLSTGQARRGRHTWLLQFASVTLGLLFVRSWTCPCGPLPNSELNQRTTGPAESTAPSSAARVLPGAPSLPAF